MATNAADSIPQSPDFLCTEHTRLRLLYSQSAFTFLFPVPAALALCILLWEWAPRALLAGWVGIILLYTLVRYGLLWRYRRTAVASIDAPDWISALAGSAFFSGAIWGAAPLLLIPYDPDRLIEFTLCNGLVLIVICGLAAGAVVAYAASLRVTFCYTMPALVPPALYLVSLGDKYNSALGGFVLLYFIFISVAAVRMHLQLRRYIGLQQDLDRLRLRLRDCRRRLGAPAHE